ncbi:MAG: BatA domain-containing protein [Phycisphaeraceae bacterium]
MFNWLGISAVNPALLWGALAIASPIIIHLLSKRKFKVIDWAAMDFLIEADKRNRRRVRMEQLILLLLRCLACLLIALLVARPFFSSQGLASAMLADSNFERIVIVDDSPSMQLQADGKITFDEMKKGLVTFVRDLSRERSRDTITLRLTSEPDKPVFSGASLASDNVENLVQTLEELKASDMTANLGPALLAVEKSFEEASGPGNRIVYLITDMRKRDWGSLAPPAAPVPAAPAAGALEGPMPDAEKSKDQDVAGIIKRLSEKTSEFMVVDVGAEAVENLAIVGIVARNKAIVRGVDAEFSILVRNSGSLTAGDVELVFGAGESVEQRTRIESIAPGETLAVPVSFKFEEIGSVPVTVSLPADPLPPDNTRHFAARVRDGIAVLVVNGAPDSDKEKSETYFLSRALLPSERVRLGFSVEEVTENQFEAMDISRFQVIILANLYRVTDDRNTALDTWVKNGGGLIFYLGDQVDDAIYNQTLYKDGAGLLPARLEAVRGDETERSWVYLDIEDANHPVIGSFAEELLRPLIGAVKVFRWWHLLVDEKALKAGKVSVPMRFSKDADNSPAFVEQGYGKGRVLLVATPVDGDWNDWPSIASYLPMVAMYAEHMARDTVGEGTIIAGMPIRYDLDAARFMLDARIIPLRAGGEPEPAPAVEEGSRNVVIYPVKSAGFYNLELTTRDNQTAPLLFAANIESDEGQLAKVDEEEFKKRMGDANVKLVSGQASLNAGTTGARSEFWRTVLIVLVLALCVEQFLAWTFGRRR